MNGLTRRLYEAQRRVEKVRGSPRLRAWDKRRLEFVENVLAEARAAVDRRKRKA